MELIIREAVESDYDFLCELFEEGDAFHRENVTYVFQKPEGPSRDADYVNRLISDENVGLFIALIESRPVGLICIFIREAPTIPILVPRRYAYIDNLVVSQNYRHRGIGRALMAKAHHWTISKNVHEIELNVWAFNNQAIDFYEKLGYEVTSLRMRKRLD